MRVDPSSVGVHNRQQEGHTSNEASKYTLSCTRYCQNEWSVRSLCWVPAPFRYERYRFVCALMPTYSTVRDTAGTALYFLEYDGMRHLLGRTSSGEQGPTPSWLPIHASLVPFVCGSLSGVTSWALIYPLDVLVSTIPTLTCISHAYIA